MAKKKISKKTTNKRKVTKNKAKINFKPDNQSLFLLIIALVVVVLAALFVARLTKGKTDSDGAMENSEQSESDIIVPKNVSQCQKDFYVKTNSIYKIDANKYPKEDICQYYKTIKSGKESIHNLQYNNEVVACRFFKENGETMIGETKYIHLGYEKKPCYQGIYKKN